MFLILVSAPDRGAVQNVQDLGEGQVMCRSGVNQSHTFSPLVRSVAMVLSDSAMRALVAEGLSHSVRGLSSNSKRNGTRSPFTA